MKSRKTIQAELQMLARMLDKLAKIQGSETAILEVMQDVIKPEIERLDQEEKDLDKEQREIEESEDPDKNNHISWNGD